MDESGARSVIESSLEALIGGDIALHASSIASDVVVESAPGRLIVGRDAYVHELQEMIALGGRLLRYEIIDVSGGELSSKWITVQLTYRGLSLASLGRMGGAFPVERQSEARYVIVDRRIRYIRTRSLPHVLHLQVGRVSGASGAG